MTPPTEILIEAPDTTSPEGPVEGERLPPGSVPAATAPAETDGHAGSVLHDGESAMPVAASCADAAAAPADAGSIPQEIAAPFWLRRSDQVFLGVLVSVALLLMLWHWVRLSNWGTRPVEIERHEARRYEYQIDINRATWVEWIQLDSIGETLAGRIIEDREQNGPFESIDDLRRVKGIGPKTVEKLRPWLTVSPP